LLNEASKRKITELDFAELSSSQVDAAFLNRIGIEATGVQMKILRLHKELREQYSPHLPLSQPTPPPPSMPPLSPISSESTTVQSGAACNTELLFFSISNLLL